MVAGPSGTMYPTEEAKEEVVKIDGIGFNISVAEVTGKSLSDVLQFVDAVKLEWSGYADDEATDIEGPRVLREESGPNHSFGQNSVEEEDEGQDVGEEEEDKNPDVDEEEDNENPNIGENEKHVEQNADNEENNGYQDVDNQEKDKNQNADEGKEDKDQNLSEEYVIEEDDGAKNKSSDEDYDEEKDEVETGDENMTIDGEEIEWEGFEQG